MCAWQKVRTGSSLRFLKVTKRQLGSQLWGLIYYLANNRIYRTHWGN